MRWKGIQAILIVGSFFTSQCNSSSAVSSQTRPTQTPPVNGNMMPMGKAGSNTRAEGTSSNEPADEGKIDGRVSEKAIIDLRLETMLNQPTPEMWFVFGCREVPNDACIDGKMKGEFSPELKKLAEQRWKNLMKYLYKDEMKTFTNAQEMTDAYDVLSNDAFHKAVENLTVKAPLGDRNISYTEAEEIIRCIGKFAKETLQTAKENSKQ